MTPLHIAHHYAADGPVLRVVGELDHVQAAVLRQQVESLALKPGQLLTLDLSGLQFCDSTGITALLAARQHAQAAGADVVLAAVPRTLLRVLAIVGLDQIFTLREASEPQPPVV